MIHLNQFGFKIHLYRGDNEAVSVKWELMTQEQLDTEKPIKNVNEKSLPPGAQSVRMATDNFTYDESELFGALSDSDEDAEGRESGVGRHELIHDIKNIFRVGRFYKPKISVSFKEIKLMILA